MLKWSKVYTGSTSRFDFEGQALADLLTEIGGSSDSYKGVTLSYEPVSGASGKLNIGNSSGMYYAPEGILYDILSTKIVDNGIEFSCFVAGIKNGSVLLVANDSVVDIGIGLFMSFTDNTAWIGARRSNNQTDVYIDNGSSRKVTSAISPIVEVISSNYNIETTNDLVMVPFIISGTNGEYVHDAFISADVPGICSAITLSGKHLISSYIHGKIGYLIDTHETIAR